MSCGPSAVLPWAEPSPCLHECLSSPDVLFWAVVLPFVGRLVADYLWGQVKTRLCGFICTRGEAADKYDDVERDSLDAKPDRRHSEPPPGFTCKQLYARGSSWAEARAAGARRAYY